MEIEKIKSDIISLVEVDGLLLYSLEYKKENGSNILSLIVDKKGFVDISDIENITNKVNEYLDKTDPINEEYSLEVSSRGLDKEILFDDCSYYLNESLEVKTLDQLHKGVLVEVLSDSLVLKTKNNKKIKVNANDIEAIHIAITF